MIGLLPISHSYVFKKLKVIFYMAISMDSDKAIPLNTLNHTVVEDIL